MTAEIRVDTIKGRSGINTFSFKGDGFSFDQKVGIGTTLASDPVKVTNAGKLSVGVVSCHTIFAGIVTGPGAGVGIKTAGGVIGYGFTTLNFIGSGNTFATSGNTVDISIAGGGGGGGSELDTSVNGTTAVGVGSIAVATHRSASIRVQIDQGANYQVGRYLMIHDGTTVTVVEEAAVATGSMLGSLNGDINHSNAELKVTMVSSGIATVTTIIDKITI
jgi:hydrogenase maturation factor